MIFWEMLFVNITFFLLLDTILGLVSQKVIDNQNGQIAEIADKSASSAGLLHSQV